jgi:hypothetical protein
VRYPKVLICHSHVHHQPYWVGAGLYTGCAPGSRTAGRLDISEHGALCSEAKVMADVLSAVCTHPHPTKLHLVVWLQHTTFAKSSTLPAVILCQRQQQKHCYDRTERHRAGSATSRLCVDLCCPGCINRCRKNSCYTFSKCSGGQKTAMSDKSSRTFEKPVRNVVPLDL